jgi:prolyl oligopeptidase
MKLRHLFTVLLAAVSIVWSQSAAPPSSQPIAAVRPVTDDYFGTKVVDPYRYMENLKDPEVQAWFAGQNDYTRAVLAGIPGRAQLLARIQELSQSVPFVIATRLPGDLYLIEKKLPTEDVPKMYLRSGLNGKDRLLADPERITLTVANQSKGKNGPSGLEVSDDARYGAVGITPGGAENNSELHVIEIATGRETGDVISRGGPEFFSTYWLPDNRSFVYRRSQILPPGAPATELDQKKRAYLHVLGTDPEKDLPVFGYGVVPSIDVDPIFEASVRTQPGSRYAIGELDNGFAHSSAYYIAPVESIGKPNPAWRKVADFADGVTQIIVHGDDLYLLTYKDAPRYKVLRIDARSPDLAAAEIVVPPGEAVITYLDAALDTLYVELNDGGIGRILRVPYGRAPKAERVALPFDGSVYAQTDPRLPGALLHMQSRTKARQYYAYEPKTQQVTNTGIQPVGPYGHPDNLESVEVKVRSYDGTSVPLSIVYPKGMKMDGSHATVLRGYGAYGMSESPGFVPTSLAWHEKGGVLATCHVRGGGEYGEEWHQAGKESTKPNTWRDFIACTQYLIDNKYTSPARLAGQGGSAGGIMVGRAITERPDLFGVVLNVPEFGSTKTAAGFAALFEMSAFHHVKDGTAYPAVLLTTGMNDPRVDPWEPGKMTARLQAATSSGKPVLLRVDYGGGHGGGSGATAAQEALADTYSFLLWQFGVPEFQPLKK